VAFVGIGEKRASGFQRSACYFETEEPYLIVNLDEACRRQQVGEGWFASIDDVPKQAISMSIRQIMKAQEIICIVPDARKAQAVKACLVGEVSPLAPASVLQRHPNVTIYLDQASSALLDPQLINEKL
jgi:glucosamine-6-phosphate deaminase